MDFCESYCLSLNKVLRTVIYISTSFPYWLIHLIRVKCLLPSALQRFFSTSESLCICKSVDLQFQGVKDPLKCLGRGMVLLTGIIFSFHTGHSSGEHSRVSKIHSKWQ